jgi:hypothetical protein
MRNLLLDLYCYDMYLFSDRIVRYATLITTAIGLAHVITKHPEKSLVADHVQRFL